jgi:signal transduction histidine kinase
LAERYPHLTSEYTDSPHHSWAAIPLNVDGHTLGGIGFSFVNAQTLTPEDCAFIQALAQQCAQAIERARAYAAERQARADSEAANRMKDEFLATLSHELRTPLNAMLGWMQLLRTRTFDPVKMAQALETIDRNSKSLAALIEDILDISGIMMGKLQLSVAPCELISVIEAAIETIRPAAEAKLIQMECCLDASAQLVWGDANRLQQVVWNLLSNAVKFTPKGGRVEIRLERVEQVERSVQELQVEGNHPRTVTQETVNTDPLTRDHRIPKPATSSINSGFPSECQSPSAMGSGVTDHSSLAQVSNCYAQMRITDTGKGISADFLPYVFDRFRQENSSSTRSYGGLGLGLSLVRYLVEQHGGTVEVFSLGEDMGSTFTVQLPLLVPQLAEDRQ